MRGRRRLAMKSPEAVMLGAVGGVIVQLIVLWGSMTVWQKARHDLLMDGIRPLPSLTSYIDPLADTLVALTRLCMGALAGLLFHDQINGSHCCDCGGRGRAGIARAIWCWTH